MDTDKDDKQLPQVTRSAQAAATNNICAVHVCYFVVCWPHFM